MLRKISLFLMIALLIPTILLAASNVIFYSASPYGTGDIKTGSPEITIAGSVAYLTVTQTGNIGAGDCIEYDDGGTQKVYICPCRVEFESGSESVRVHHVLRGAISEATGVVRAIEFQSGSWIGGTAAGYIYFSQVTGTFVDGEELNRIKPTGVANVATTSSVLQGDMEDSFVVKTADGTDVLISVSGKTVTSIHHEFNSLSEYEANHSDADHLDGAMGIQGHCCAYYDHDDQTLDTTPLLVDTWFLTAFHYIFTPQGNEESVNNQRHDGKWNGNRYILQVTGDGNHGVDLEDRSTLEGFQIELDGSKNAYGVYIHAGGAFCIVSHNIIKGTLSGGSTACTAIYVSVAYAYIWNNIIYDFVNGSKNCRGIEVVDGVSGIYVYNNTVHNCYTFGIDNGSGTCDIKNNIVNDCGVVSYSGSFGTASTHNIGNGSASELAYGVKHKTGTADGTSASKLIDSDASFITNGVKIGCVVKNTSDTTYTYVTALDSEGQLSINDDIFVSGETYEVYTSKIGSVTFNNEGSDDFHLGSGDTIAIDLGSNLSADEELVFWDDIDSYERSMYGDGWDIGADEYQESENITQIIYLEISKKISCDTCDILDDYCPNPENIINCCAQTTKENVIIQMEITPEFECNECNILLSYCPDVDKIKNCYVL